MAESRTVTQQPMEDHEIVVDRARDFWTRNNRMIMIIGAAIIVLGGGYLAYKKLVKEPNEQKASEAMFRAQEYFGQDSINLALNGDGVNLGFVKIADKWSGTRPGKLASYYAGACYLQIGDAAKAVKYLSDFSTDAPQIQARAFKLLGDAYAEQGKKKDAFDAYRKAAHHFEQDEANASEYLFMAAYITDDKEQAISLFRELKTKYPRTRRGVGADKYLARLGVYSDDKN